ncbi:MAG: DUF1152 domain-containing protein [Candidatus Nezhaarchaeota archaeon]|nr:DUF1152 domain-containing protein [Candidatus Nezhaarchaeota archaeon]
MEELRKLRRQRVLVLGIGGGGDVASAYLVYSWLKMLRAKPTIGGVVWERFPVDPVPGPIALRELSPLEPLDRGLGWASPKTAAYREGRVVRPQLAKAAGLANGRGLALDLWLGPVELARELERLANEAEVSAVIGVDVGGDVLAKGLEEDLWSPLADQVMLACLTRLEERGVRSIIAIHGLGVDGELSLDYLIQRLGEVASHGAYLGALGMGREGASRLQEAVDRVVTEASALTLAAFRGEGRVRALRRATRKARLSIISSLTFFVDPAGLAKLSPMVKALASTASLEEANSKLHELGIYTELDLERDLYRLLKERGRVTSRDVLTLKREGARRIREGRGL